ncbi:MAG: hypothetical protein QOD86_559 [Miltoncostaeaceae bacterium]|nr:hypothetical protein [Miltoncostaeaceae bacterium]
MEDRDILNRIEELIEDERALRDGGDLTGVGVARLRDLEVALDEAWDLLRQRRARREADLDPADASLRDAETVEGYEQ